MELLGSRHNSARGILAEYIVSRATGVTGGCRVEWNACDVVSTKSLNAIEPGQDSFGLNSVECLAGVVFYPELAGAVRDASAR